MTDGDDLSLEQLEHFLVGTVGEPYSLGRLTSRSQLASDLVGTLSVARFDERYDAILRQFIEALTHYGVLMREMAADMQDEDRETVAAVERFLNRE